MDGCFARPRFSFVCAKRGATRPARCVPSPQRGEGQDEGVRTSEINLKRPNPLTPTLSPLGRESKRRRRSQRRALWHPCLLIQIPRHALPRCALWRADIARRGREDVLPRLPLQRMRHAIKCAAQAASRVAAAAALPAACPVRTGPPQGERIAIAELLQRLLDREAARVLDGAQLRLGFHARLEHGGQYGKVLIVLWFGAFHGQIPPSRGALLRSRSVARTIARGSRVRKKCGHVKRETGSVQGKGRGGPAFRSSVTRASPIKTSSHK